MTRLDAINDKKDNEPYSEREAQRRFRAAIKAAVNTPPKPLKSMTQKGTLAQSKKRKKKQR
jgi:hypothetical protein